MYTSIAFGGGGTRGGLHMGVLRALAEVNPSLSFPDGIYACSIGCVFALAAAFHVTVEDMETVYSTYFGIDGLLPYATVENLNAFAETNGLMPMDGYLTHVIDGFRSLGIDLRGKVMADAPQPLYFLASNMTTGRPTWLTGQVPILDALACSGCIPFVFRPQILYGDVYLDGGVFVRCIGTVVPRTTLAIHISGTGWSVTPNSTLADLCVAMYGGPRDQYRKPNILVIKGPSMTFLSDVTPEDKAMLVTIGASHTRAFLTKRFPKELEESRRSTTSFKVTEQ